MKSIKWGVRITRALVGLSVIRKTIPVIFLSWPSQFFSFLLHHFELLLCCFSAVFHTDSAQLLFSLRGCRVPSKVLFTAKHLTVLGLFRIALSKRRGEKKKKRKKEKGKKETE